MERPSGTRGAASLVWALALLGVGFAVELVAILRLNAGRFTYTLDDPYIHLALAERIRRGLYGINPGEAASPASSLLDEAAYFRVRERVAAFRSTLPQGVSLELANR